MSDATIANTAITYFDCREINGLRVMSSFPAVQCDGADYNRLIPVIYTTLVGVVAGIPCIIVGLLTFMFVTGRLGRDPTFVRRFGTLYENYRHGPEMQALLWVSLFSRLCDFFLSDRSPQLTDSRLALGCFSRVVGGGGVGASCDGDCDQSAVINESRAEVHRSRARQHRVHCAARHGTQTFPFLTPVGWLQSGAGLFVCLVPVQVEPYLKISDNLAETLSFIVLALVTAVLATAPAPLPDEQNIAFNVVVYVTAAVLLARTLYVAIKKV
jgi:hypothetical protein